MAVDCKRKQPPRNRQTSSSGAVQRSTVTPSPKPTSQKSISDTDDDDDDDKKKQQQGVSNDRKSTKNVKATPSTKRKADSLKLDNVKDDDEVSNTRASKRLKMNQSLPIEEEEEEKKETDNNDDIDDDDEEEDDDTIASQEQDDIDDDDDSNAENIITRKANDDVVVVGSSDEEDDDDDDIYDRPFTVEYATSCRSTCRRCDSVIQKGDLRISHVPLFRGKPGYRVYRHLVCAVFSEDIHTVQDIGGYKKLNKEDVQKLADRIVESKLEIEAENEELDPDELVQKGFQGEIRTTPKGFIGTQLPFQVEGQSWMYHQEVHTPEIRGGILADEMGMGKTIQTITAILDNRPTLQHCTPGTKHLSTLPDFEMRQREEGIWAQSLKEWKHEMAMNNVSTKILPKKYGGARTGTLVICPLVALSQWKAEIEKFTEPNCLTVGIYHGPNRESDMTVDIIRKYDVVLTTYQVLEQDFRKMVSPNKVTCPNCNGKFKIDKLRVHLTYFCGAAAKKTEAQARQRRGNDRSNPGSGGGSKKGGGQKKKFPETKTENKISKVSSKTKSIEKKFESDDSDDDSPIVTLTKGNRPSRAASKVASKKLKYSVNQWNPQNDIESSESNFDSNSDESSDDDDLQSDDESIPEHRSKTKSKVNKSIASAKQKQAEALAKIKMNGKSNDKKKSVQGKKQLSKKSNGKKKFDSDPDSDDSDDVDPMEGIDINELMDEAMAGSRCSFLHSFCWWRVVLDEAHFIKSRSSQTAAAAFAITAVHRWCLSGTPLQNRVGELYSLIRFLRIDPMAHYFCRHKGCECKSIHYRMKNGRCLDCEHPSMMHFSHFNKHVLNPIQRDGYSGDGRRAMFLLRDSVLNLCLLRRTKQNRSADMNLPPRLVTIRPVRLHPVEEDFYEALYTQTKSSFDDYVAEGTLLNNYAHIFDLLTKMRQAVNHPYLIVHSKRSATREIGQKAAAIVNGARECAICHEPPTGIVVSTCCDGLFCRSCVLDYLSGALGEGTPCPSCSAPFTIDLNQTSPADSVDDGTLSTPDGTAGSYQGDVPSLKTMSHVQTGSILRRLNLAEFATSTKIEVLVQELIEMRHQRPGSKALVFSQFVNMLDLVRWRLHSDPCLSDMGLGVCILHGGMDAKSRDAALKNFRENSNCRVLLLSLKAAGVALNLTVASECFLLDLWWNPAAELQAIDRCHRLGQYRPIRAVRFVAEGTVEERVLQLQEKKRLVFDGTVGGDAGSLKLLTVDDMKALFA